MTTETQDTLSLGMILLFKGKQVGENYSTWCLALGLDDKGLAEKDKKKYKLDFALANDVYLLRLTLTQLDCRDFSDWQNLRTLADKSYEKIITPSYKPFAITYLYHVAVPGHANKQESQDTIKTTLQDYDFKGEAQTTTWGWIWHIEKKEESTQLQIHNLVALVWKPDKEVASKVFLDPLESGSIGWSRIELHRHNTLYYVRLYEEKVRQLDEIAKEINRQITTYESDTESTEIIESIENNLIKLIRKKMTAEMDIGNAEEASWRTFDEKIRAARLETLYEDDRDKLKHKIEQGKMYLTYVERVQNAAEPIQNIWSRRQADRLQQANSLLGIAVAILTVASVIDSVLDIWNLLVTNYDGGFSQPHPLIRVLWGFIIPGLGVMFLLRSMLDDSQINHIKKEIKRVDLIKVSILLFIVTVVGAFSTTWDKSSATMFSIILLIVTIILGFLVKNKKI